MLLVNDNANNANDANDVDDKTNDVDNAKANDD
jgi:hypothetical protein